MNQSLQAVPKWAVHIRWQSHLASASIAQWLEHWSCKPGVVSSILTGGFLQIITYTFTVSSSHQSLLNYQTFTWNLPRKLFHPKNDVMIYWKRNIQYHYHFILNLFWGLPFSNKLELKTIHKCLFALMKVTPQYNASLHSNFHKYL